MEDMEAFLISNKNIEIEVFKGELDKYSISESGGLSLRGVTNGKMGYSYTEKLDESSIDMLIEEAYENGKYIDATDVDEIFHGSEKYAELNLYNKILADTSMSDKINFALNIEKEALTLDKRVVAVQSCGYEEFEQERMIVNTKSVSLSDKSNGAIAYVSVVVQDGEDTKTGMAFRVFTDLSTVDYKEIAKEAVNEAISMLGAVSIKSGNYPTILKNNIFADILEAFSSVFSADNAQKDISILK